MGTQRLQWSERRGPRRAATRFRSFRFRRRVEWGSGRMAPNSSRFRGCIVRLRPGLRIMASRSRASCSSGASCRSWTAWAASVTRSTSRGAKSPVRVCHGGRSPALRLGGCGRSRLGSHGPPYHRLRLHVRRRAPQPFERAEAEALQPPWRPGELQRPDRNHDPDPARSRDTLEEA